MYYVGCGDDEAEIRLYTTTPDVYANARLNKIK
jgi:hypothetical protein